MRTFFLISLFVFSVTCFVAQNAKIIEGPVLDDSPVQLFIKYIDTDSSGIYFLKKQKEKPYSVFIEKYNANTLQRVYRCALPSLFDDNDIGTRDDATEKRHFAVLKNGCVYLLVTKLEGSNVEIYSVRVDKNGKSDKDFPKIYTQTFMGKIKRNDVHLATSPGKNYLCIYNKGETKNTTIISNLKINYADNASLKQVFEYNLEYSKTEDENSIHKVFDNGHVGSFYHKDDKVRFATVGRNTKLYNKSLEEFFPGNGVEIDIMSVYSMLEDGGETPVAIYNKKTKQYGFISLKFDTVKNELVNMGVNYLNNPIAARIGKTRLFDQAFDEVTFRENIATMGYNYRILSRSCFVVNGKINYDKQSFIFVLIYDKQNKLVEQRLVPFKLDYLELYQMMVPFGDFFASRQTKNYSTITRKDTLYVFTLENTDNRHLDPDAASVNDFEVCKNIKSCYFTGYKIIPGGKTERFVARINNPNNYVFTIPGNKNLNGNCQYVYLKINDKRTLGKIVLE